MEVYQAAPALEASSKRKRVSKACDRCRLKKSKCDALNPCRRCKSDNAICVYGDRKNFHNKVFPQGYGEMLEQQQAQLVTGLQQLYKKSVNGEVWPGPPLKEVYCGNPLTHDILERLGALKKDNYRSGEQFQENVSQTEQRLKANEAVWIQKSPSSNGGLLETDQLPILKDIPRTRPQCNTPVASKHSPKTQSAQSTYSHSFRAFSHPRFQEFVHSRPEKFVVNPTLLWPFMPMIYNQKVDSIDRSISPVGVENISSCILQQHISSTNLSACLPVRDWVEEEDFYHFNTAFVPESI